MRTHLVSGLACLALILSQASCDKHPTAPSTKVTVTARPPSISGLQIVGPDRLPPGSSDRMTALALKTNGSQEDVTAQVSWSSDNPGVLAIDGSGRVTAHDPGAATVQAVMREHTTTQPVIVVPKDTFVLSGVVLHTVVPLEGAKVEIVSAAVGGGLTATTDSNGVFTLFGLAGHVKLRVGKDEYKPKFPTIDMSADQSIDVDLTPSSDLPDLRAGKYAVTLSIGTCAESVAFPSELRVRTYRATVTQTSDVLDVRLEGASFVTRRGLGDHFQVGLVPDGFYFSINRVDFYRGYYNQQATQFDVFEQVSANQQLGIFGQGTGTGTEDRITARLDGGFVFNPTATSEGTVCRGPVSVSMVRQ
jgi:hypothetical protein